MENALSSPGSEDSGGIADIGVVFESLDPPVWIVTASSRSCRRDGDEDEDADLGDNRDHGGLAATFVSSASIVPSMPRVLVGIARQHWTWQLIESSACFALHLLREDQLDLVWSFGLSSGRDVDKLRELSWSTRVTGAPVLDDTFAWLDCRVETSMETGDRSVYLAEVVGGGLGAATDTASRASPARPLSLRRALSTAPPEILGRLRSAMESDRDVDRRAITRWRDARRARSGE